MVVLGFVLSLIGFGINKRIWSPSFVFVSCGFASWMLGLLTQYVKGGNFWLIFGMNPLFLYVLSEVLGILFGSFGIKDGIYSALHSVITDGYLASLAYALFFVGIHAALGYVLYRKRIFIKI